MTDPDNDALAALRGIDSPADLADGAEERIEAAMLARFDEVAASSVGEAGVIVQLDAARDESELQYSDRRWAVARPLAAAAVLVLIVAGLVAALDRPQTTPVTPAATTAVAVEARLATQLDTFCADWIVPARDAASDWRPGRPSEATGLVIVAIEQAGAAMSQLEPPLGERLMGLAQELVDAGTEARLANTLGRDDADDAINAALDLIETAPAVAGVEPVPTICLR